MKEFLDFLKLFVTTGWGITILIVVGLLLVVLLYRPFFKAFFDCLLAFIGLVVLSPIFLIIAILVKKSSPGTIFFRQQRVGKNKKLFTIHKFRTMRTDTPKDCPTHMLANADAYITKIGKFLRKTSLDELPQIWDIFRLKMSIIGPRPALYNQDDLVAERDKYGANNIRPGLTGLAQVSGRDELEIPEKAKLDGDYKKKRNIFIDIKIFFLTILKVFEHDGVKEGGTGAINAEKQNLYGKEVAVDVLATTNDSISENNETSKNDENIDENTIDENDKNVDAEESKIIEAGIMDAKKEEHISDCEEKQ